MIITSRYLLKNTFYVRSKKNVKVEYKSNIRNIVYKILNIIRIIVLKNEYSLKILNNFL